MGEMGRSLRFPKPCFAARFLGPLCPCKLAMDLGWIVSPLFVGMIGQVAGLGFALVLSGLIGLSGGAALLFKGWKTIP